MKVIKDFSQFSTLSEGLINNSVGWKNISHTQDVVLLETFLPYLGADVCGWLDAYSDTLEAHDDQPKYWLERAMCRLMLSTYLKTLVEITPNGALQTSKDDKAPAFKYKELQYMSATLRQGYNFLEKGIMLLESVENEAWMGSNYLRQQLLMRWVPWASDMSALSGVQVSRWDYERVVPAMDDISMIVISKIIPDDIRESMIIDYLRGNLSDKELKLFKLIQRAVTHLGISEAVSRGWVQITGGNVIATEVSNDAAYQTLKTAPGDGVSLKLRTHNLWGSEYVNAIITYMLDHHDSFEYIVSHYRVTFPAKVSESCTYNNKGKGIFRL